MGLRLRELRLVGPRIDDEEQIALAHFLAFLERDAIDVAADARTQFDAFHGRDATGVVVPLAHVAFDRVGDADLGRRRTAGLLFGRLGAATAEQQARSDGHRQRQQRRRGTKIEFADIGVHFCFASLRLFEKRGSSNDHAWSR